jgi:predicted nucleic acid-binding protein
LIAYADTGFLVSLYGEDALSTAATKLAAPHPLFIVTSLVETEFANAVRLRVFRKEWTQHDATMVQAHFDQHQAAGFLQSASMNDDVWESASALSRRYSARLGTRTLDVLHVATALALKADVFFTFDKRQRKLAKAIHVRVLPA